MGAEGRGAKRGGKVSRRPGEPERSGGSDRLAAVLLRDILRSPNPTGRRREPVTGLRPDVRNRRVQTMADVSLAGRSTWRRGAVAEGRGRYERERRRRGWRTSGGRDPCRGRTAGD